MMRACHEVSLERAAKPASDSEGIKLGIEKYQRIKGILEAGNFPINTGEDSEPLCKRYNYVLNSGVIETKNCVGCPIRENKLYNEQTGLPKCAGTPWEQFSAISTEVLQNPHMFDTQRKNLIELCDKETALLSNLLSMRASILTQ